MRGFDCGDPSFVRSFQARHPSSDLFPSAVQRCALRQAVDSHAPLHFARNDNISADRRSALSHCEKSGNSGVDSASARSGCAKQRSLLCPLSERWRRRPRFFAVLDLLLLLDQAKSREEKVVDSHAPLRFARNDNSLTMVRFSERQFRFVILKRNPRRIPT